MSLIDKHELSLPNTIIDTISALKTTYINVSAKSLTYLVGFEHGSGIVELEYTHGIVSLTIIEYWPVRIQRVYSRKMLTERQRQVIENYLQNNFA